MKLKRSKIWNDMANYRDHIGKKVTDGMRNVFGALIPGVR
jgi:hypothetical protein